ncbi:hypothetical protein M378DRAFT_181512 [Amanita muscaria Koide BX008]|uniref:Uncharacterized protein n=1 Tax=Amanita muscaria (strain Koide BX008) TaxID=946122 RepID=A0A0C2S519_AMAMK|nr:hypothetical protein M378DRAFT_181512 [Amanita muscaria Koide BX008]
MAVTLRLFIFSLIIGLLAYLLFAVRSRNSFGTYFSPPGDSSPVQDVWVPSVSSESTHLQGWHKRALSHPHPNPHFITPEDDIVELAVTSSSMIRSFSLELVIFKSAANISSEDEDDGNEPHRYIVVDALGRVSVLPSTSPDINGILSLGRQVVLEFPTPVPWEPQEHATCQPLFNVAIAIDSEEREGSRKGSKGSREMKTTSFDGYPQMNRIKVQNKGYEYLPDAVRDLFLLVLEADQWDEGQADKVVIEKVAKGTGYSLDW